ncbi:hypothetical protein [Hymenobacter sp. BT190]|uniref:hypothetical protein n=1 Tax=Hymenobacter sp. BT190 TaxID=2763505 RepID=UPI0016517905|nr:hypothetical protein [Hymenobacter sp. BT190]MBC6697389.1 hypothetical protein [Hymenobacter sp. BT190]
MMRRTLLLLLGCIATAILLAGLLVGFQTLLQLKLEIQMHNTYFVLPPYWLVLALLFPLLLLALAGTALWRKSPKLSQMLLVAASLLLLFGADLSMQVLNQLTAVSATMFPAEAAPPRWLLLAQVLHLAAIAGVGFGCYQLGSRATNR